MTSPAHRWLECLAQQYPTHEPWTDGGINPDALDVQGRVFFTVVFEGGVKVGISPGKRLYTNRYGEVCMSGEDGTTQPHDAVIGGVWTPADRRGEGRAGQALRWLVEDARSRGVSLWLEASTQDKHAMTSHQLTHWYRRLGFASLTDSAIMRADHNPPSPAPNPDPTI